MYIKRTVTLLLVFSLAVSSSVAAGDKKTYQIETIASDLSHPGSMVFVPGGDMLVMQMGNSQLVRIQGLGMQPTLVKGLESLADVQVRDIALHPDFAENHLIYFVTNDLEYNRILRGIYQDGNVTGLAEIFRTTPPVYWMKGQPGGRLVFLPDHTLLVTIGDGYILREQAQNMKSYMGKTLRLTDDGKVPADNPFVGEEDILPEIWTSGHRQALGILYDPIEDIIWSHENGPQGGDELNFLAAGKNYGWPFATYGQSYTGTYISPLTSYPGTEQPLIHWTPSLAPSGLAQCRGCLWPEWEGDLFVGMLWGKQVCHLNMQNNKVVAQGAMFQELAERIRDVRFGLDGALYLATDSPEGRVLRVTPVR